MDSIANSRSNLFRFHVVLSPIFAHRSVSTHNLIVCSRSVPLSCNAGRRRVSGDDVMCDGPCKTWTYAGGCCATHNDFSTTHKRPTFTDMVLSTNRAGKATE